MSKLITKISEKFQLSESFLSTYKNTQPKWTPLGYFVYKRTYARLKDNDETEEFWETLKRVTEGTFSILLTHLKNEHTYTSDKAIQLMAEEFYKRMWDFKFLPPGRGLWMMGTEFVEKNGSTALNNCGYVSTDPVKFPDITTPFTWTMLCLMLGVGVGFDTRGANRITIHNPLSPIEYYIDDSREGWVKALEQLLRAYFYQESLPLFDYSLIRPVGERIKQFGGVSSGPEPLKQMLKEINNLLHSKIGTTLTSVDILDIMNYIGKCIVSGNVRRSAEISIGHRNDMDFVTAKQDQKALESHRWAANISIDAKPGETKYELFEESILKNGEPGIVWLDTAKEYGRMIDGTNTHDLDVDGVNPCGEMSLCSGELCCLVETNPSNHTSMFDYQETLYYALLYAKCVSMVSTTIPMSDNIIQQKHRIGVSQTGIVNALNLKWFDINKAYMYLKNRERYLHDRYKFPFSIKLTTVKPSGTTSLLMGVPPGIHYPHSQYYIRRIRVAYNSDLLTELTRCGFPIEQDIYSPNSKVIEFPVKERTTKTKSNVSIQEQLDLAEYYQRYWSDNQVSITVTFDPEKESNISELLYDYEDRLKGVSFIPLKKDVYEQMPYEEITEEEYERRISEITMPDFSSQSKTAPKGVVFCDGGVCTLE